jgi:hypothetical protein
VRCGSAAVRRLIAVISSRREGGSGLLAFQLVAQGLDDDAGDRLAGPRGQLARPAVGFVIPDVQGHGECRDLGMVQHQRHPTRPCVDRGLVG